MSKAAAMPTNPPARSADPSSAGDAAADSATPTRAVKPGSNRVAALNFRVSPDFKKAFKIAAATHGVTQSDLLQQAFDEWRQRHG
jgi:hypothetical protein